VRIPAALAYGTFSLFGLAVVVVSTQSPHRLWGACAAAGYGCAALISLARVRWRRELALIAAVAGGLLVPLCWLAAAGRGMPEVWVVAHSAELLVRHGRPYQSAAVLGADVYGYNPYLPGMTVFGLPQALFGRGVATDPRVWDGLAFVAAFASALRIAGGARGARGTGSLRRTAVLTASPLIAFPLAVSGNDLAVLGLTCLGLALTTRPELRRPPPPAWAGIALGGAAALKATAWPALLIVAVLFLARDGRGAAARFAAAAGAVLAVVVGPILVIQPADLVVNTIGFPLGLTRARSPAASPLPGHLIAAIGPAGHLAVIALLAAAGIGLGVLLAVRPPRNAVSAAGYLALALTMLFLLAPATRWGYFIYPASIGCWLGLSGLVPGGPSGSPRHPHLARALADATPVRDDRHEPDSFLSSRRLGLMR
jgi:glycosyl transferase family 87